MGKSDAKKTSKRKRGGDGEATEAEQQSAAANNVQETSKKPKSEAGEQAGSGDADKKPWNLKLCSWNVNGVRAWLGKEGLEYLKKEQPDVFAIQETKCSDSKLPPEIKSVDGYHSYFLAGDQEGYSGVALLTKIKPLDVKYGIGVEKHDKEGRVITAEFEKFYLVAVYVPNAGKKHLYPDKKGAYTFWTYMMNARAKNVGWRLDYFILSNGLESNISDSLIHSEVMGSDHCPVVLLLNI
ncbi:hypothetical protein MTO96_014189 [Rhipicephalus appendiculatus]